MAELTFGEFLHSVRSRTKGTHLAKAVGISYVYLLDLEKGARPVPSSTVLNALADSLSLSPIEREQFFDLAAKEKGELPIDVTAFVKGDKDFIAFIRQIKNAQPEENFWSTLSKSISAENGETTHAK